MEIRKKIEGVKNHLKQAMNGNPNSIEDTGNRLVTAVLIPTLASLAAYAIVPAISKTLGLELSLSTYLLSYLSPLAITLIEGNRQANILDRKTTELNKAKN